ncbi:Protein of unknown function [Gryllus bimaculatus]|nr:Protein of unknown function [Gryllus bimaculatus]
MVSRQLGPICSIDFGVVLVLNSRIPVEILRQLSDIENATYFLNNFVDTESLTAHSPTDIGHELESK